ncbi:MAG: hypothetical protein VX063_08590, partial [SAR324 cluster bacterium]|nr:hypothetical protein [SAR324 cluster bacterium]
MKPQKLGPGYEVQDLEGIINKPLPAKITAAPIRVQTSGISPKKRNPKRLIQTNLKKIHWHHTGSIGNFKT